MSVKIGLIVPGLPHPLLAPDGHPSWKSIRNAYEAARQQLIEMGVERIVIYSTQWFSILGHQIQADPNPEWIHVDQEFHELGEMPYSFYTDVEFANRYVIAARSRGLHARTVSYHGFPVDTGSIVANNLLNPDNRFKVGIVSCNMYADRAETVILGKAAADVLSEDTVPTAVIAVTCLSERMHTEPVADSDDRLSSLMDDEWNRKLLELLDEGRLEDVSQLARTFAAQAHADNKLKAIWWLSAVMGQHNRYTGNVMAYGPIFGTGSAVVSLLPAEKEASGHEFDEDNVEFYQGDRDVLAIVADKTEESDHSSSVEPPARQIAKSDVVVSTSAAPKPVGAYPHARRVGNLLYLSGVGPRQPGTDAIPGGPIKNANGPLDYDAAAQTRAVIENIKIILEASGASLSDIVDVTAFLIDMDRDFKSYNAVYAEYFTPIQATRTTIAIRALPTPIAVEFKVIAVLPDA
ncbi:MAG: Rid family hydrolase [Myxococcota bacterium]|nr:Rid family hydrolase [Myxococcota bacterium]